MKRSRQGRFPNWPRELTYALMGRRLKRYKFSNANVEMIGGTIRGLGPDAKIANQRHAARVVVNIPSVHAPSLCEASRRNDPSPYKNAYDLEKYAVGDAKSKAPPLRILVDNSLPLPTGVRPNKVYFGAIELNGAGIRFYGDICLVLRPDQMAPNTVILDRNSYDFAREPFLSLINNSKNPGITRRKIMREHAGTLLADLEPIASIKVLEELGDRHRRYTTGQISTALLNDEDYIEVLKEGSFGTEQLEEARTSISDVMNLLAIETRLRLGPPPSLSEIRYREVRRDAERALQDAAINVRPIVTPGRTKG